MHNGHIQSINTNYGCSTFHYTINFTKLVLTPPPPAFLFLRKTFWSPSENSILFWHLYILPGLTHPSISEHSLNTYLCQIYIGGLFCPYCSCFWDPVRSHIITWLDGPDPNYMIFKGMISGPWGKNQSFVPIFLISQTDQNWCRHCCSTTRHVVLACAELLMIFFFFFFFFFFDIIHQGQMRTLCTSSVQIKIFHTISQQMLTCISHIQKSKTSIGCII